MEQIIDIYDKEVRVFQDSQNTEIKEQRQSDDQPALFILFGLLEHKSGVPGRQGRCGDEDYETEDGRNIMQEEYDEQPDTLEEFGNDVISVQR